MSDELYREVETLYSHNQALEGELRETLKALDGYGISSFQGRPVAETGESLIEQIERLEDTMQESKEKLDKLYARIPLHDDKETNG